MHQYRKGKTMNATTENLLNAIRLVEDGGVNKIDEVIKLVGVESARALYAYRIAVNTSYEHAVHVLEVAFPDDFYPKAQSAEGKS